MARRTKGPARARPRALIPGGWGRCARDEQVSHYWLALDQISLCGRYSADGVGVLYPVDEDGEYTETGKDHPVCATRLAELIAATKTAARATGPGDGME